MHRRQALLSILALPLAGHAKSHQRLAAAWESPQGAQVGVLMRDAAAWRVAGAVDVPTRPHGIVVEPEGSLLAVARRPGDWLLRWSASGRALNWVWAEPDRRFNGHARRRGAQLFTTETDVETGEGRIVVRDARTLQVQAVWASGGLDPHDLAFDADGTLWVANGGIPTQPETGRAKRDLDRMDSSLVRLDAQGRMLGQWRLYDRRLSLRHLALRGGGLGVALQAEHDDPAQRAQAPVLALFDGDRLRTCESPPLAGYAGDIVATAAGYAVSVPRAGGVAVFDASGRWERLLALDDACALASSDTALLAGGNRAVLTQGPLEHDVLPAPALRLDNHWQLLG